jgi:hypothetical protein
MFKKLKAIIQKVGGKFSKKLNGEELPYKPMGMNQGGAPEEPLQASSLSDTSPFALELDEPQGFIVPVPPGSGPVRKWTEPPTALQMPEDDTLFPLAQLTAQKRQVSLIYGSWHPLLNFLCTYRYRNVDEADEKGFLKVIAGIESTLTTLEEADLLAMFFRFFASRQGFILFRCSLLSLRYFARMVPKIAANRARFIAVFTALNEPMLIEAHGEYDRIIQMVLTDETIARMDQAEMDEWTANLLYPEPDF